MTGSRYWIVDLAEPLSLVDCQLAAQFGYQDATAVTTAYTSTVTVRDGHTFTVTLALDHLLLRGGRTRRTGCGLTRHWLVCPAGRPPDWAVTRSGQCESQLFTSHTDLVRAVVKN